MKRITTALFSGILFLTACGGTPPLPQPRADSVSKTATPSPLPSATPTITVTPLPTIPTFTPTFDVSTIVTVTPAPKAECPKEDPNLTNFQFNFGLISPSYQYVDNSTIDDFMTYLNKGGQIDKILEILDQLDTNFKYQDMTNDNNPDLIFVSGALFQSLNILYCSNGQYIRFPSEGDDWEAIFGEHIKFEIQDLNMNNIQDVLSITYEPRNTIVKIWEWNGQSFMDLTPNEPIVSGLIITDAEIIDINNDGILELVIQNVPSTWSAPWRYQVKTLSWDGKFFSALPEEFEQPIYRFQAIQDGDLETLIGKYSVAQNLYRQAIFNNELEWWSTERKEYEQVILDTYGSPTPSANLVEDPTEYPRLAAYAYYRIMLLYLVQNQETEATETYNTLQQEFGNNPYARPYVEMASAFWEAYQPIHSMYDGCAAAIQYAVEHTEVLIPLGSDYHGWQSHIYEPADVCPFR